MSDKESNRDAIARRMLEIATYNELTGAGAPVPRPDPRGQDFRGLQQRQQELATYNELFPPVPMPVPDPRGQDFRGVQIRNQEIEDYPFLINGLPLARESR